MKRRLIFFTMTLTFKVMNALMLIARFFFTALQFVVITSYTVSLRLAKKKQQRTLNTTQLRILGQKKQFAYVIAQTAVAGT